jgi:hypothetical protein
MIIVGQQLSCEKIYQLFKTHVAGFNIIYDMYKLNYEDINCPVDFSNLLLKMCESFNLLKPLCSNLILYRPFETIYNDENKEELILGLNCDENKISLEQLLEMIETFKIICHDLGLPIEDINCYTE